MRVGRARIAGLLLTAGLCAAGPPAAHAQDAPPDDRFDVTLLDKSITQGTRIATTPDGRVLLAERDGRLKVWKPTTQTTVVAGQIPTGQPGELGFMGLALSPDFATTGYVYAHYVPLVPSYNTTHISRVSRFTLTGDTLDLTSEKPIYDIQHPAYAGGGHSAGDLEFAPNGDLYISTGDNTNCCASFGYPPMDERPGQTANDSQTTAANTNNPMGKILRIHPLAAPGATVGAGSTYSIPPGNLFDESQDTDNKTLPEIYAMGLRNPFTIGNAKSNGELWFADYGPDATLADPTRGPAGHVSMILAKQPANFGWPYCYVPGLPYADWDYVANVSRGYYDCDHLVNNSPNNLNPPANQLVNGGRLNLPPATKRTMWWTYSAGSPTTPFSDLFGGGAMAGPLYAFDAGNPSTTKFPAWFNDRYFYFDWTTDWVQTVAFNPDGTVKDRKFFLPIHTFVKPMDMKFGPDGSLYVLAYGNGWGTNNDDTGLYKVDYAPGNRAPIAGGSADKDSGAAPLTVNFDATGSSDPDVTDTLTYAWDFTNDGVTDATTLKASHTYTTPGAVTARLTVTDSHGSSTVQNFPLVVGNARPVVKITAPADGTPLEIGQPVSYHVDVTDADGPVDCTKVALQVSLGHNSHAHPDQIVTPDANCNGTVTPNRTAGHTGTIYVFTVFEATYTDAGNGAAPALTGYAKARYSPHTQPTSVYPLGEGTGLYTGQTFMQGPGHWLMFEGYNLARIGAITMSTSSRGPGGTMEIHADSPTGPLVGSAVMPDTKPAASLQRIYTTITAPTTNKPAGSHDLYFVTNWTDPAAHGPSEVFPEIFFNTYTLVEYPEVSLSLTPATGDASNGWYTTPVKFTIASTGFSAATREYRLDGGAWTPYTAEVTVGAPGAHTLEYRGTNAAGTTAIGTKTFTIGAVTDTPGTVSGSVPATLSLTLGAPATFGAFTPGVAKDYTASTTATVTSTAGDAALSVSDPGHLTNGAFALPEALQVAFSKASWAAPASNDAVTLTFKQHIGAGDALRTGAYSKTLTFTLSTTTP
ncbi:PQQ-dependent sugar dehydrogenase [Solirubrobacter ginsenosidimutans]|uniref:PQQ-dependent sugar dehydrogenase n=1 Tax=Solirubrobacter ginsenosidimutans TaxID=490573 RepID=A0A9X3MS85_9ACTN|nr:PQQ-dependent sugar dehydrogenase [Solirubrobacter ginsenosidimutans]MDA0160263.1 PQQ-dependent sugar dehydrogenase [Solirubrobacter ginsenosidimutans]